MNEEKNEVHSLGRGESRGREGSGREPKERFQ